MEIESQITEESLAALGDEALRLVCSGDLSALAQRFGYARAFGRDTAAAVEEDLKRCLGELGARSLTPSTAQAAVVKHFVANDSGLFALVECVAIADSGAKVLVELVVTGRGAQRYITLEDISVAA